MIRSSLHKLRARSCVVISSTIKRKTAEDFSRQNFMANASLWAELWLEKMLYTLVRLRLDSLPRRVFAIFCIKHIHNAYLLCKRESHIQRDVDKRFCLKAFASLLFSNETPVSHIWRRYVGRFLRPLRNRLYLKSNSASLNILWIGFVTIYSRENLPSWNALTLWP